MPEGIITSANHANAIATIVAARALGRVRAECVGLAVADPSYANEVAQHGQTVNVPIPAEYTTNLMTDGGTIARQQTSLGNAALTLNKHRELSFALTDRAEDLARPDVNATNLGQAMANFAEDVSEDLLGIYASFSTTDVGTYNTALTESVVSDAETTLFNARVPQSMRKSLVVTGAGYSALRQIARFTEADKIAAGSRPIAEGFVGRITGMDVYRDQTVVVTSSTDRHGIALAPPALLVAVRPLERRANGLGAVQVVASEGGLSVRLTMSYVHEMLGQQTTIDTLYGFVAGRANFGVEVRH